MSVEFDRGSPGKFDSRTLNRKTLNRWTGRMCYLARRTRSTGPAAASSCTRAGRLIETVMIMIRIMIIAIITVIVIIVTMIMIIIIIVVVVVVIIIINI